MREGPDLRRTRRSRDGDAHGFGMHGTHDVQPAAREQTTAEGQTVRIVVVAGDDHHRNADVCDQPGERLVEEGNSFRRGNRPVVDVTRNDDRVGTEIGCQGAETFKGDFLILDERGTVEDPA